MVDLAALPPQAEASPRRRAAMTAFYILMLIVLPPVSLLPIFPAFMAVRQDRRLDLDLVGDQLSLVSADPDLADGDRPDHADRVPDGRRCAGLILPRVSSGSYSIHSALLRAEMDGRAGDRGDAGHAVLAVRDDLHAGLVPDDGRQHRQGLGDLDQSVGPLRRHRHRRRQLHRRRGRLRRRGHAARLYAPRHDAHRRPGLRRQRRGRAAGRHHSRPRADRHQVEAAGQRADAARRHLVRLAADPAADAAEGRSRRDLDLPALLAEADRCAALFEALHTSFPAMLFITFGTHRRRSRAAGEDQRARLARPRAVLHGAWRC